MHNENQDSTEYWQIKAPIKKSLMKVIPFSNLTSRHVMATIFAFYDYRDDVVFTLQ